MASNSSSPTQNLVPEIGNQ